MAVSAFEPYQMGRNGVGAAAPNHRLGVTEAVTMRSFATFVLTAVVV